MHPRHFSEPAGALTGQAVLRQAPLGEPGCGLGPVGHSAQGHFSSPMDFASTSPFSGPYPAAAVLVLGALFTPQTPSPAGRGVSRTGVRS